MTIDEVYQAAKLRVRKAGTDNLDLDIQRIVNTAITDLGRIGVNDGWLESPSDPLIVEAILSYVKANYTIDTAAYPILSGIYDMNLTRIKGDGKYFVAPESVSDPDSGSGTGA